MNAKAQRNDPCPCGSGKKYKKCCGLREAESKGQRLALFRTVQKYGGKNMKEMAVKLLQSGTNPILGLMPQAFSSALNTTSENEKSASKDDPQTTPEAFPDDLLPAPQVSSTEEPPKSLC